MLGFVAPIAQFVALEDEGLAFGRQKHSGSLFLLGYVLPQLRTHAGNVVIPDNQGCDCLVVVHLMVTNESCNRRSKTTSIAILQSRKDIIPEPEFKKRRKAFIIELLHIVRIQHFPNHKNVTSRILAVAALIPLFQERGILI